MLNNFFIFSMFFSPTVISVGIVFKHIFNVFLENNIIENNINNLESALLSVNNVTEDINIINNAVNTNTTEIISSSSSQNIFNNNVNNIEKITPPVTVVTDCLDKLNVFIIDTVLNVDVNITFKDAVYTLQNDFKHILHMNYKDLAIKLNNLENFNNFEKYFECVKIVVKENSSDDFDFFLSRMKGSIKKSHINLFNMLLSSDDLENFLLNRNCDILLSIVNKKVSQI